jgi:hypothetical protein
MFVTTFANYQRIFTCAPCNLTVAYGDACSKVELY